MFTNFFFYKQTEQSRRDDLESLGYLFIYFLNGSLPWQNLKARTKLQKYARICEKKLSTPIGELCKGHGAQFISYFMYCRNLSFEEAPDYRYLHKLLRILFFNEYEAYDGLFDWIPPSPKTQGRKNLKVISKVNDSPWTACARDEDGHGVNGLLESPLHRKNAFSAVQLPQVSLGASAGRYPLRRRITAPHFILPPTKAAIEDLNRAQSLSNAESPFQMQSYNANEDPKLMFN